ncbi:hypothetical protein ACHAW5_000370 [Stephanodiscus triporus]|uniref:DUF1365-domain-containing protein n=1 Tax=Stephanodiscus triporus TaxID=2934178 RepID=A0ABD3QFL7_9STRA
MLVLLILGAVALLAIPLFLILPAYTLTLAVITILRARCPPPRGVGDPSSSSTTEIDGSPSPSPPSHPWSRLETSFFRGTVFHVRHRPIAHSFKYPLHFCAVDLDESSELFGSDGVRPHPRPADDRRRGASRPDPRGSLWPLSSLMSLRDAHHLRNGEGGAGTNADASSLSMRERISNLVRERTRGRLDLRSTDEDPSRRRRIVLVTHLMYYGYCFNPVSFFFVLRPKSATTRDGHGRRDEEEEEEDVEAVVVEVSNTPWNEMHVYVLHPESVDTVEYSAHSSMEGSPDVGTDSLTHRYKWRKGFHVSPFMTMDHDYDWKFRVGRDRIWVEARMVRRKPDDAAASGADVTTRTAGDGGGDEYRDGQLFFTAGFDVRRAVRPTSTYPLQLARVILRFPSYCLMIQLWIHYEALRLLIKGVEFVPHPRGSETGASRAIAALMGPAFRAMNVIDGWRSGWRVGREGKIKGA